MIGYPLDSHVEYDSNGTPIYDRAITSAPLRKLYKQLFSDGVMPNPSTNMQVSAGDGMNVIVAPGFAMCNGCLKLEEAQRTLAVQASSTAYDRIDTVVLRLNDNDSERICDLYILQGTPATSPVRPELTRTESIWELGLADLFVAKNSTVISNQRITDTRYETTRCGIISSISQFDTETLYQQIQADLAGFKEEEQADFIAWFEEIRAQLSEDAAGNLQNQIGSLPSLVTEIKDSLVNAINWVVNKLSTLANKIGDNDISGIGDGTVTGAIASQNETFTKQISELSTDLGKLIIKSNIVNKTSNHGYIKDCVTSVVCKGDIAFFHFEGEIEGTIDLLFSDFGLPNTLKTPAGIYGDVSSGHYKTVATTHSETGKYLYVRAFSYSTSVQLRAETADFYAVTFAVVFG